MIIYLITNKINGNQYVGQTTQLLRTRIIQHKSGIRKSSAINGALRKYGSENFSFSILGQYSIIEDLDNAEEYFIQYYNCLYPNGYNLKAGRINFRQTEEVKRKISEANRNPSAETRKKMREAKLGKPLSESHKKKLSELHKARVWNPEHRKKQHLAQFGRKVSEETRQKISAANKGKAAWNKGSSNQIK